MNENKNVNTRQQMEAQVITSAVQTGLKMLQSQEIVAPTAWKSDLVNLEQILMWIATGQLVLTPPEEIPGSPAVES